MKRMAALLLFVAGCSSAQSDPWQDYLIALQIHDFELKAMRQAEQIESSSKQQEALARLSPSAIAGSTLTWRHRPPSGATVAIVAAGTSDLSVADEARLTLEALGHGTIRRTDVGVAGLQRLLDVLPDLNRSDLIVAIAGMEGALPTVLAGLVAQPIVAVPTSAGYGSSFAGATALLSMMASCAPGIVTVGIDNGYGAACAAHRMLRLRT